MLRGQRVDIAQRIAQRHLHNEAGRPQPVLDARGNRAVLVHRFDAIAPRRERNRRDVGDIAALRCTEGNGSWVDVFQEVGAAVRQHVEGHAGKDLLSLGRSRCMSLRRAATGAGRNRAQSDAGRDERRGAGPVQGTLQLLIRRVAPVYALPKVFAGMTFTSSPVSGAETIRPLPMYIVTWPMYGW